MRRGRPKSPLTLTAEEIETLERWVRCPTTAQALAQRARIVLACTSGDGDTGGAAHAPVTRQAIGPVAPAINDARTRGGSDGGAPGRSRTCDPRIRSSAARRCNHASNGLFFLRLSPIAPPTVSDLHDVAYRPEPRRPVLLRLQGSLALVVQANDVVPLEDVASLPASSLHNHALRDASVPAVTGPGSPQIVEQHTPLRPATPQALPQRLRNDWIRCPRL